MGLTKSSFGAAATRGDGYFSSELCEGDRRVALLGNPNVGKSSLFNALTGLDQHTGNWPGKTVTGAVGRMRSDKSVLIADLPGTYSLITDSAEEEVARDCILFERPDLCLVVCDATVPERGLPLVLQTLELTSRVAVCFNLEDIADKNGIKIDTEKLSKRLGVPVVCASARKRESVAELGRLILKDPSNVGGKTLVSYPQALSEAIDGVTDAVESELETLGMSEKLPSAFVAHRLIEGDGLPEDELRSRGLSSVIDSKRIKERVASARAELDSEGRSVKEMTVGAIMECADRLLDGIVTQKNKNYREKDRRADRVLTGRILGFPIMVGLLLISLWLTVIGANYPSEWLSVGFETLGELIERGLKAISLPEWLTGLLVDGVYRVLAFVVSVMLPPMAIFFPLFTILEDIGYLPRVAYNLDRPFARCGSCGKQALTMCMGLGCNAAGVVGCRIIESPRERILAMVTNSFVPCNGRFPTFIALIGVFFTVGGGVLSSLLPAAIMTAIILLGVAMTFIATRLLSSTLMRGVESSFVLEMPPFRPPNVGKVIVRSVFDRTLFVLGRAAAVAAPMGAVIWIMANITVGNASLLGLISDVLDPVGRLMGLDGVILLAFILGFPANEIVLPLAVMMYTGGGVIGDAGSVSELGLLLAANGWTHTTAISFIVFSLMHWPCSTTVMTVKKESGSLWVAFLSVILPTAFGFSLCVLLNLIF